MAKIYRDRLDAGRELARALLQYQDSDALVIGLARGGVVVGYAVADLLHLPLQALVVRKIGAPMQPELAIGAISETGTSWLDHALMAQLGATASYADRELRRELTEAQARKQKYVPEERQDLHGKSTIVVDDGIATGATSLVAIRSARELGASTVILATPVASRQAVVGLQPEVDELVVLQKPIPLWSIGAFYRDFQQVTDEEVQAYLHPASRNRVRTDTPQRAQSKGS